jgi:hypothetical protein
MANRAFMYGSNGNFVCCLVGPRNAFCGTQRSSSLQNVKERRNHDHPSGMYTSLASPSSFSHISFHRAAYSDAPHHPPQFTAKEMG